MDLYGRKASWRVKRDEKYGRNPSWIVIRYGKYRRKLWKDMENMEKKGKLKSEMIWKIWKISVIVIITTNETSSSSLPPAPLYIPPSYSSSSWNNCLLETMQVGIKFAFSFIWRLEIPQWERGHPWSTTKQPRTHSKTTNFIYMKIKGTDNQG